MTLFFRQIMFTAAGDVEAGSFPLAEATPWFPLRGACGCQSRLSCSEQPCELTMLCGVPCGSLSPSPLDYERLVRAAPSTQGRVSVPSLPSCMTLGIRLRAWE